MPNTKDVGDIAETYVAARFLELGWPTMKPLGDNQRYDLVVDRGSGLERVQVKSGRRSGEVIEFQTCSSPVKAGDKRRSYRGQIELFAVWDRSTREVYVIPADEAPVRGMKLRLSPAKNGQTSGVNLASDFRV